MTKAINFVVNLFENTLRRYNDYPDEKMILRELIQMEDEEFDTMHVQRLETIDTTAETSKQNRKG